MSELWMMFQRGAGVGAWVVGMGLVMAVALPVFGMVFAVIAWVLRGGPLRHSDTSHRGRGKEGDES